MVFKDYTILWVYLVTQRIACGSFIDLEELKTSLYSVAILDEPVAVPSNPENKYDFGDDQGTIHVSSRVGQQYVCHYKLTPSKPEETVKQNPAEINITDLLEPMRGYCLTKTKDWWSYEFCYGSEITQFHMEHGKKTGDIITLGVFESDQQWTEEALENAKKSSINRYHTQQYVNGSVCDLTKKQRRVEARFSCLEGEPDHIGAIAELETCSYIIFIYTSKICHHPYLRPPVQATPSPIQCQPLVSQAIYDDYVKSAEEAAEKLKLELEAEEAARIARLDAGDEEDDGEDIEKLKASLKEQLGDLLGANGVEVESGDFDSITDKVAEMMKDAKMPIATKETSASNPSSLSSTPNEASDPLASPDDENIVGSDSDLDLPDAVAPKISGVKTNTWLDKDYVAHYPLPPVHESIGQASERQHFFLMLNLRTEIQRVMKKTRLHAHRHKYVIKEKVEVLFDEILAKTHLVMGEHNDASAFPTDKILKRLMAIELDDEMNKIEATERREGIAPAEDKSDPLTVLQRQEEKLMKMLQEAMKDPGKGTVASYKENIRQYLTEQFDDIIDEARQELEAGGEEVGTALTDLQELKRTMSGVLEAKLDELEELEKLTGQASNAAEKSKEPFGALKNALNNKQKGTESQKNPNKKKKNDLKLDIIKQNEQMEVEMIDLDAVDKDSIYYQFKDDLAKKKPADNKGNMGDNKEVKTMLAVLKPMAVRGTRMEEKRYDKMAKNYDKTWTEKAKERDEL